MPGAGTEALRPVASEAARERIGLIACRGRRGVIAGILASEGFALALFDRVETVTDIDGSGELAAMVLWVEDAISCVASLVEALTKRLQQVPVVVVCASIQRREVRAALVAGAAGVVLYEDLDSGLGACLRAVGMGLTCVPRGHWREIEPPVLSLREKQVLGLVAMGYMNRQIAERLFLSESTVKSHLSSAFGKLGVRSRNEAADLILNHERGLGVEMPGAPGGLPALAPATAG